MSDLIQYKSDNQINANSFQAKSNPCHNDRLDQTNIPDCRYCRKKCYPYSYSEAISLQNRICAICFVAIKKLTSNLHPCTECKSFHSHNSYHYTKCSICNNCHPWWSPSYFVCTKNPARVSKIANPQMRQYDTFIINNYISCTNCSSFHPASCMHTYRRLSPRSERIEPLFMRNRLCGRYWR